MNNSSYLVPSLNIKCINNATSKIFLKMIRYLVEVTFMKNKFLTGENMCVMILYYGAWNEIWFIAVVINCICVL